MGENQDNDVLQKRREEELLEQLEVVGDSPRFVWKLFFLCMVPSILNGLNVTSYVYLTDVPGHWCAISELDNTTWTLEQKLQISSPKGSNSSCEFYDIDYAALAEMSFDDALLMSETWERRPIPCRDRAFAKDVPSMVLDFDLVCERTVFKSTIQVAISLGKFLGAFLFGIVSDKFGRRVSFLCGALLYIFSGPLIALAGTYGLVILGRIGIGAAGSGIYHSAFVILSEVASKRRRASIGILYNMSYPIGEMIVPAVAYFVRDWRTLQFILSAPAILTLLFWWYLPESPRWLLSTKRYRQAEKFISHHYKQVSSPTIVALKTNDSLKRDASSSNFSEPPSANSAPPTRYKGLLESLFEKVRMGLDQVYQLVRYGELRWRMAIAFFTWCVCSFSYYGLALNTDNFSTDRYVYGFLTGLVEAPSYLLPLPMLRYMGRRYTAIVLFYVSGAALLLVLALPESQGINIPLLLVVSVGRLCISGVFAVVILHTTELFPTLLRNTAIGIASTSAHIGSMSAPLFVDLVGLYYKFIPSTVFGLVALLAGTLVFLLPETKNKPLPGSIEDIVNGPKKSKVGFHQICR